MTPESFELLLRWLNPDDQEKAAEEYRKIHVRLIKIFCSRGCLDPEHLADTVMDRVTAKIPWLIENYVGNPEHYFYGVAKNVCREEFRPKPVLRYPPLVDTSDAEELYKCLDECMDALNQDERKLVLEYHEEEKQAKIRKRKQLATQLGISLNALRIKVCRIHSQLEECIIRCLAEAAA